MNSRPCRLVLVLLFLALASASAGCASDRAGMRKLPGLSVPPAQGSTTCAAYALAVALSATRPELGATEEGLAQEMGGLAQGASAAEVLAFVRSRKINASLLQGDAAAVRDEVVRGRPVLLLFRNDGEPHFVTAAGLGPGEKVLVIDSGQEYLLGPQALDEARASSTYLVIYPEGEGT